MSDIQRFVGRQEHEGAPDRDAPRFAVLGQVRAMRDGRTLTAASPQQQAFLAALLLHSGRASGLAELVYALWGENPPDAAVSTVRTHAWRWRTLLERGGGAHRVLLSVGDGYRVVVPELGLDLDFAEDLARRARQAGADGRLEAADKLLADALALWQGNPLSGLPGPFAEQQRVRLGELRLAWTEERLRLALALGRHALVLPELTLLAAEQPSREHVHELLMRALHAAGRQTDALAVFSRLRQALVEGQGIEPGAALKSLHHSILAGEPPVAEPVARTATALPRPAPAVPVPRQLPSATADFTGRHAEIDAVVRALTAPARSSPAVVAVTGTIGVGKSALALQAAHRVHDAFPDGELYADLGAAGAGSTTAGVLEGFLRALGLAAEAVPDSVPERSKMVNTVLDGRKVLVVLDNVRVAEQIRPLVPGSAGCGVLITGWAPPFGVPTTERVCLGVFTAVEALDLLGAVVGAQRVAADRAGALALVEVCGLLPLAVRSAGAHLAARPRWSFGMLTARLASDPAGAIRLGSGDRSMLAALRAIEAQLTDDQHRAFLAMASAGPEFGLRAASAVLGVAEREAEDLVESLVDVAVLESPSPGQYRYSHLLWSFARHYGRLHYEQPDPASRIA
ncbi:AfsR/SARP family transcriptional regulator [Umezawaea tangerina]|uniref:DNA-binding SARP family transcriptional activator n=1 Tax=Umezawaea tangerina TaxID=84725 RepID=A0A2T0SU59_9PSEU|nr:BTAD domain-containing putative transcriptional regulator [Umezawaea tangerina]PRY36956.1 DNA-binding SARP family transcriptional activator [Umezawaea tangerina]